MSIKIGSYNNGLYELTIDNNQFAKLNNSNVNCH